jgi:glutamate:GABA antiporter
MSLTGTKPVLNTFLLVMLITGAIDSIRNFPAAALFGSALIFFFLFAAVVFLIPSALVSAELSAGWTEKGGIYHWVKLAFGEKMAFVAIWLQWINTLFWFPTILSFIASVPAYLIHPEWAQNRAYLVSVVVACFWLMTLLNLKGIRLSAKFSSLCTCFGMLLPMALIIVAALAWIILGKPLQIHFALHDLLPDLGHTDNWISLTAIMTTFLGMELITVYVKDVQNPQKTFPRALGISVAIILFTMIMGSLAIALILPVAKISLVDGTLQAMVNFLAAYHLSALMPVLTVMILIGSLGGMINWIISPTKGLLHAAESGYLPRFFQKQNKAGMPSNLLLVQAVLVSVLSFVYFVMPSVNGSYWLLSALTTQIYMLMYFLMFLTGIVLRYRYPGQPRPFRVGRTGNTAMWVTVILGLIGVVITLIIGFFPPAGIDVGGTKHYEWMFSIGMLIMVLPALLLTQTKRRWVTVPSLPA